MMVHELNQRLGNMFHGPFGRGQSIVFGFFAGKVQGLALCFQKDFVVRSRIVIDRIFAVEKNNKGSSLPDKIQADLPEPLKKENSPHASAIYHLDRLLGSRCSTG